MRDDLESNSAVQDDSNLSAAERGKSRTSEADFREEMAKVKREHDRPAILMMA